MFHLITHAFFKALLFLGAGSVIHGCHDEQDIRSMGGLKTVHARDLCYLRRRHDGAVRVCRCLLLWLLEQRRDSHAAIAGRCRSWPFYLGLFGALLTAFYMTRQVCYVFFGNTVEHGEAEATASTCGKAVRGHGKAHAGHRMKVRRVMTLPLAILAVFAVLLGFVGTPAWPWFQPYLGGHRV